MAESITGPVPAKVPVYIKVCSETPGKKKCAKKDLGLSNARVSVYAHDKLVKEEEGLKDRKLCQITVTVRNKAGRLNDQVEEIFDLDHSEASPYLKASTQFPGDCNLYTLIIKRPADPGNIDFQKAK